MILDKHLLDSVEAIVELDRFKDLTIQEVILVTLISIILHKLEEEVCLEELDHNFQVVVLV